MKAVAVVPSEQEITLVEHPEPIINSPTEVKLRMLEVGVCGTDKEIARFEYGAPPAGENYLIIGHESLAEVVETGAEVERVRAGDLIVMSVRRPCPHESCTACRMERQDFCFTGDFTERGIKERHGFMTEFVTDDEKYLNVLPPHLRAVGVLVEPLTIAEKALAQVWQVQERLPWTCAPARASSASEARASVRAAVYCHRALVLGAGPVGLLGAMAIQSAGFETFVYSRESETSDKARLVESFGAKYISAETYPAERLAEAVTGVDLVYEAVGASALAFEVLKMLDANAVFVFTGVPGRKAPVAVDTDLLMRNLVLKNQIVFGTVNADRAAFEAAIRDLEIFKERWPGAVESLITSRVPPEAHRELLLGQAGGIKNVIKFV